MTERGKDTMVPCEGGCGRMGLPPSRCTYCAPVVEPQQETNGE